MPHLFFTIWSVYLLQLYSLQPGTRMRVMKWRKLLFGREEGKFWELKNVQKWDMSSCEKFCTPVFIAPYYAHPLLRTAVFFLFRCPDAGLVSRAPGRITKCDPPENFSRCKLEPRLRTCLQNVLRRGLNHREDSTWAAKFRLRKIEDKVSVGVLSTGKGSRQGRVCRVWRSPHGGGKQARIWILTRLVRKKTRICWIWRHSSLE